MANTSPRDVIKPPTNPADVSPREVVMVAPASQAATAFPRLNTPMLMEEAMPTNEASLQAVLDQLRNEPELAPFIEVMEN